MLHAQNGYVYGQRVAKLVRKFESLAVTTGPMCGATTKGKEGAQVGGGKQRPIPARPQPRWDCKLQDERTTGLAPRVHSGSCLKPPGQGGNGDFNRSNIYLNNDGCPPAEGLKFAVYHRHHSSARDNVGASSTESGVRDVISTRSDEKLQKTGATTAVNTSKATLVLHQLYKSWSN